MLLSLGLEIVLVRRERRQALRLGLLTLILDGGVLQVRGDISEGLVLALAVDAVGDVLPRGLLSLDLLDLFLGLVDVLLMIVSRSPSASSRIAWSVRGIKGH